LKLPAVLHQCKNRVKGLHYRTILSLWGALGGNPALYSSAPTSAAAP